MDVSIIIVNYNTCQMTKECIDSVFERTFGLDFEIILVDNGSTDGSKSQFEKDSRITYVYSEFNLGFGCANNLGYKFAKGDYVFLLNSDTEAALLLLRLYRRQDIQKRQLQGGESTFEEMFRQRVAQLSLDKDDC